MRPLILIGGVPTGSGIPNDTAIQVSINGALPVIIDDSGIGFQNQVTSVSALGKGAVVVWTDAAADPTGDQTAGNGVMGAILDADGSVLHTFDVNQTEVRSQYVASQQAVAELADGGFVVTWAGNQEYAGSTPDTDLFVRVFNADGTPRGDEIVIDAGWAIGRPTVLGLPGGGFAASWVGSDYPDSIRLQQFDGDGNKIGAETGVGSGGGQSMTVAPDGKIAIAYLGDGLLRVQMMEPHQAPSDIALSGTAITENVPQPYTVMIGTLAAVDDNASDTFTYELLDNAGGFFRLEGASLFWNEFSVQPDHEAQSSYEIQVRVTDSAKVSFTKSFTIEVSDVNEPVTGITEPTSVSLDESAAIGTIAGTLAGIDPDLNETFTYELLNADVVPFKIEGNAVVVSAALDYETASSHVLSIRVTDSGGNSVDVTYTVGLNNEDDTAPSEIELYTLDFNENAAVGTEISYIYAADSDTFADLTYELTGENADLFEIRKDEFGSWRLYTKAPFDAETASSLTATIKISDPGGRFREETFTLTVNDVNDAPVITSGANFTVEEGSGRIIQLAATDKDGDAITWSVAGSLVSDDDFTDFFAFDVDSEGYLILDPGVDDESPWDADADGVYHFSVRANDGQADTYQEMTVTVVGGNADPVIDGDPNIIVDVKENETTVKTIVASDPHGDTLTYSISGGPDSELFDIVTANGKTQLVFKSDPDFENPGDLGGDNSYNVSIRTEDGNGGFDDQAVAVHVENVAGITFKGTAKADRKTGTGEEDSLSGAGKKDTLDGQDGADVLNGGTGKDKLTGGDGDDIFIFNSALDAKKNVDKIIGFSVEDDTIHLDASIFKKIGLEGAVGEDAFAIHGSGNAAEKFERIIYDDDSGKLFYDADGSKKKSDAVLFATLDKALDLTAADFLVI